MVGRIMSKPEKRKTPGKKMMTTTYKKGGSAKKKSKFPDHSGDGKITKKDILMAKGVIPKKKQGYKDRKDESIAMRVKKKRTAKQLKASANESYGKFGSKAKKSGKINK